MDIDFYDLDEFFKSLEPTREYLLKKKRENIRLETIDLVREVVMKEKWKRIGEKVAKILDLQKKKMRETKCSNAQSKNDKTYRHFVIETDRKRPRRHRFSFGIKPKPIKILSNSEKQVTNDDSKQKQIKMDKEFEEILSFATSFLTKYSSLTALNQNLSNEKSTMDLSKDVSGPLCNLLLSEDDEMKACSLVETDAFKMLQKISAKREEKRMIFERLLEDINAKEISNLATDLLQEFIYWCEAGGFPEKYLFYFMNSLLEDFQSSLIDRTFTESFEKQKDYLCQKIDETVLTERKRLKWKCLTIRKGEEGEYQKSLLTANALSLFSSIEEVFQQSPLSQEAFPVLLDISQVQLHLFLNNLSKYDTKEVLEELLKEKLKTIWIEFFKKSASDFLYEENVFFFTEVCLALQISLPDSERDEFLAYLSEHSVKDLPKQMEATTSTDQSPCCSHSFENGELDLKELDDSELFEMLSTATGIQADNLLRNDLAKFQKDVSTKIWSADRNKVKCLLQNSIKNYAKKLESLELSGETSANFCQKFIQDSAHYLKPIFGASLDIDRLETELKIELRAVNGFSSQTKGRSDSSVVAQNNDLSQNRPNWKEWGKDFDEDFVKDRSTFTSIIPVQHSGYWSKDSLENWRSTCKRIDEVIETRPNKMINHEWKQPKERSNSVKQGSPTVGTLFFINKF